MRQIAGPPRNTRTRYLSRNTRMRDPPQTGTNGSRLGQQKTRGASDTSRRTCYCEATLAPYATIQNRGAALWRGEPECKAVRKPFVQARALHQIPVNMRAGAVTVRRRSTRRSCYFTTFRF